MLRFKLGTVVETNLRTGRFAQIQRCWCEQMLNALYLKNAYCAAIVWSFHSVRHTSKTYVDYQQ